MAGKRANGEGSIYQQADGRWVAALTGPDGRKRYYGKTRRQVHERLTRALKAKQDGLPIITDERQTVGQFLGRWLDHRVKPRVRPSTYRGYEESLATKRAPGMCAAR